MNFSPKWPFSRSKNHFSGGPKQCWVGPKHAPGTPGIPKKFQVLLRPNHNPYCVGISIGSAGIFFWSVGILIGSVGILIGSVGTLIGPVGVLIGFVGILIGYNFQKN